MAGAVTLGVVLGAVFDLTLGPFGAHGAVPGLLGMAFAVAATAGVAGGLLGAAAGALWGWLLAQVADAVVSRLLNGQAEQLVAPIVAWTVAILAGWGAGKLVQWAVERVMARHPRSRPYVAVAAVAVCLSAALLFLYGLGRWGVGIVQTRGSFRLDLVVVGVAVSAVAVVAICLAVLGRRRNRERRSLP
jgi:hypothetical protein